jgi:ADP-ribose pyrophosphatase YjhB (NUDIX family)
MRRHAPLPKYAVGIIERTDDRVLIARAANAPSTSGAGSQAGAAARPPRAGVAGSDPTGASGPRASTSGDQGEDADWQPTEWMFPRGPVHADESPEAAMRRLARDVLGITVEIVIGEAPVRAVIAGRDVQLRCFLCGVVDGEAASSIYAELRWVLKPRLREYEFDAVTRPIVDWLLEE